LLTHYSLARSLTFRTFPLLRRLLFLAGHQAHAQGLHKPTAEKNKGGTIDAMAAATTITTTTTTTPGPAACYDCRYDCRYNCRCVWRYDCRYDCHYDFHRTPATMGQRRRRLQPP
jgi:hypothetical protein